MEIPKKVKRKEGYLFGKGPKTVMFFWTCDQCGAKHSSFEPHWIVNEEDGSVICDNDDCWIL